jgi:hypothetical protein
VATTESRAEETVTEGSIPTSGTRTFHTGLELGIEDALEVTRANYSHLIGILGAWDAGKTCFLLSLYLLAARAALPNGYRFAGSLTLKGFEDRARRLRKWKGGPLPEQIADHTSLSDTRQAALLHLALRGGSDDRRFDLLLPDLPGEWCKNLVDRGSTADRFSFLKRADGIILVVDGKALDSTSKRVEITRSKHLLERLKESVGVDLTVPMTILVSKGDAIGMKLPSAAVEVLEHATSLGFGAKAVVAAAFSYNAAVASGTGVFEALEPLIAPSTSAPRGETDMMPPTGTRRFAAFKGAKP